MSKHGESEYSYDNEESRMSQEEINEQVFDILKCIIHSSDLYEREQVDLSAVAFLRKLGTMIVKSVKCPECGKEHFPDEVFGAFCDSDCYAYHYGDKVSFSRHTVRSKK